MKFIFQCITLSIILASPAFADEITKALAGKTLIAPGQEITAHSDGRLIGKVGKNLETDLVGTWEIKNGQWCRTLTQPKAAAGRACQDLTLGDGVVTIEGSRGPVEFTLN